MTLEASAKQQAPKVDIPTTSSDAVERSLRFLVDQNWSLCAAHRLDPLSMRRPLSGFEDRLKLARVVCASARTAPSYLFLVKHDATARCINLEIVRNRHPAPTGAPFTV